MQLKLLYKFRRKIFDIRGEKMIIDVIVCRADGTQEIERREVADDWFDIPEETPQGTEE